MVLNEDKFEFDPNTPFSLMPGDILKFLGHIQTTDWRKRERISDASDGDPWNNVPITPSDAAKEMFPLITHPRNNPRD
jgi:hypothetical protein